MAALRTALLLVRFLLGQLILVPAWLSGADTQLVQGFEVHQPQKVSVMPGETLTLRCTVTAGGPNGPVKWLKGWGSDNKTIYDQKDPSTWEKRAVKESNTDFTILIRDVRPEDDGTYYCVKYRKITASDDELYRRGDGTVVRVVQGTSAFPSVEVATAVLFFLLLIFILIFCVYHKKCRGSPGTPSNVRDAETPRPPQQSSEQKDIHYADLQPLREAPQRSQSPGTDHSEYASIRAAAK